MLKKCWKLCIHASPATAGYQRSIDVKSKPDQSRGRVGVTVTGVECWGGWRGVDQAAQRSQQGWKVANQINAHTRVPIHLLTALF